MSVSHPTGPPMTATRRLTENQVTFASNTSAITSLLLASAIGALVRKGKFNSAILCSLR